MKKNFNRAMSLVLAAAMALSLANRETTEPTVELLTVIRPL